MPNTKEVEQKKPRTFKDWLISAAKLGQYYSTNNSFAKDYDSIEDMIEFCFKDEIEQSENKEEITEEKLLEFNLEQEFDRFYFTGHGNEYSIRISKTGGRLYGCGNNAIPVFHVHEFQNWYKLLTGNDLLLTPCKHY